MQKQEGSSSVNYVAIISWFMSLALVGGIGFLLGVNSKIQPTTTNSQIASNDTITPLPTQNIAQNQPTIIASPAPTTSAAQANNSICARSGPSQKKDYLKPYTLKEGDTVNKIAEEQLGDVSRNSEITTLNENMKNLTVGSILYLPPDNVKQSSGYIYEVSGKIVKKDNSSWQITYGASASDLGIWMPAYFFKNIPDTGQYNVGDCVTILFDNGSEVYSVRKQ